MAIEKQITWTRKDAQSLTGIPIVGIPTNGQFLVYNATTGQMEWQTTSQIWQEPCIDYVDTAPVGAAAGDRYIVKPGGPWNAHANEIATSDGAGGWTYETPAEGWAAWVDNLNSVYFYDADAPAWIAITVVPAYVWRDGLTNAGLNIDVDCGPGLSIVGGAGSGGALQVDQATLCGGASFGQVLAQSIPNGAHTAIVIDAPIWDSPIPNNYFSPATKFQVPAGFGGKHLITAHVTFAGNVNGIRGIDVRQNWGGVGAAILSSVYANPVGVVETHVQTSIIANLVAGDYVEMYAYQSSGGALATINLNSRTFFQIQRLVG